MVHRAFAIVAAFVVGLLGWLLVSAMQLPGQATLLGAVAIGVTAGLLTPDRPAGSRLVALLLGLVVADVAMGGRAAASAGDGAVLAALLFVGGVAAAFGAVHLLVRDLEMAYSGT